MSLLQGTSPPLTGSPLSIFYKDPSSFPMLQPRAEFKHEVHIISLCNNNKKKPFSLKLFWMCRKPADLQSLFSMLFGFLQLSNKCTEADKIVPDSHR